MSLWHIAWGYLWNRKLPTLLTIASVALAVGLISSVLTLRDETRRRFEEEGRIFDVVVGAKGSPLQLVLCTTYFMDVPTGNIYYEDFERLRTHEDVRAAFPIGLGDTFRGFRIVGTTADLLDYEWESADASTRIKPFVLAEGRKFEAPMEAVVGSTVARVEKLKLGDTFVGVHGFMPADKGGHVHADHPYTVVGILEPSGTPNDRAIFCDLESVYEVHAHKDEHHEEPDEYVGPFRPGGAPHPAEAQHEHDDHEHGEDCGHEHGAGEKKEITAILVALESPALQFQFQEYVNADYNAMAARPVNQIQKLYAQLLETVKSVLLSIGYLVVVISALSIMIGLYLSIVQRKRDLAVMRALGASSTEILGSVLIEAFLVTVLGVAAGWVIGGVTSGGIGLYLGDKYGLYVNPLVFSAQHALAFGTVALVGLLAGIIPAWQAYRTDVARDLQAL